MSHNFWTVISFSHWVYACMHIFGGFRDARKDVLSDAYTNEMGEKLINVQKLWLHMMSKPRENVWIMHQIFWAEIIGAL